MQTDESIQTITLVLYMHGLAHGEDATRLADLRLVLPPFLWRAPVKRVDASTYGHMWNQWMMPDTDA